MNYKVLANLLILFFTLGYVNNTMSQQNVSDINRYYLKVESRDALFRIYLNGTPILRSEDDDTLSVIEQVNLWLVENENILSFEILKPDEDGGDLKPTDLKPIIQATLFLHDNTSEFPLSKKILAEIEHVSAEKISYPIEKSVNFNYDDKVLPNLWNDASKIKLVNDSDKAEILKLTNALANSLIDKKYDDAIKLQKYKIQEDALAEGKSYSHMEGVVTSSYNWLDSQGELTNQPVNPDEMVYMLCGNGQMVYLSKTNSEEAIVLESDEVYFDVPIYFANIKGVWTIVR